MNEKFWYLELIKPNWAPPAWIFGPVWSVLYIIIFVSFGTVFLRVFKGELPYLIALPFALNLLFNLLFTPLQFGLQNNELATLDILFILFTLVWSLFVVYPYVPWVTFINLPYLFWVIFATGLQLTITYLN